MANENSDWCPWEVELHHFTSALRAGLADYCRRPIPVALLVQRREFSKIGPIWVFDPDRLLSPHRSQLKSYFGDHLNWKSADEEATIALGSDQAVALPNLGGLISSATHVMFTAVDGVVVAIFLREPEGMQKEPITNGLEAVAPLLVGEILNPERLSDPFAATSYHAVRSFSWQAAIRYVSSHSCLHAEPAVHSSIVAEVIQAILEISRTTEEGALPSGQLQILCCHQCPESLDWISQFPEQHRPELKSFKHIGKVLKATLASDNIALISTPDRQVRGIASIDPSMDGIRAVYQPRGNQLFVNGERVCNFHQGTLVGDLSDLRVDVLKEILSKYISDDAKTERICARVQTIARKANQKKHGCTLVLDCNLKPLSLSGQPLSVPLDTSNERGMETAVAMSAIDGALHIDQDSRVHAFGCLLDGSVVTGEQLSRGARYNSALRFAKNQERVIVVVVSEDGMISLFCSEGDVTAHQDLVSLDYLLPVPSLENWFASLAEYEST